VPPDGFGDFLVAMKNKGFSDAEIDVMARRNPARLVGLP
jgi:predicted metal-dependent phosphotriesterase family hydrolase